MATDTDHTPSDADGLIVLPEKLGTAAASGLMAELAARRGSAVVIDCSAVTSLGGRCLDLLLSARKTWSAAGNSIEFIAPSDAMLRDLATLGVTHRQLATGDAS